MTLQEAADELGLHYMTVYKYVRTGRLDGSKVGGEWRVRSTDVAALAARPRPSRHRKGPGTASYVPRLVDRLVAGDGEGAWAVVEGAMASGVEPSEVYLDLLAPALRTIGDRWADGTYSIAQEHQATAVVTTIVGRLSPRFTRPGRKRGSVVVGAPPGDEHALPVAMAADLLRAEGFRVHALGDNVPAASFEETASAADRLVAVSICATTGDNEARIAETVRALHAAVDVPVFVGGGAIADADAAARLGADACVLTMDGLARAIDELARTGELPEAVAVSPGATDREEGADADVLPSRPDGA